MTRMYGYLLSDYKTFESFTNMIYGSKFYMNIHDPCTLTLSLLTT